MWSKRFWLSLAERALKTFLQALIAVWPLGDAALGLFDVDWRKSVSVAGMAALVSVVTSVLSSPVGPDGSPSLVGEPPKEPAAVLDGDPADARVHDHALDGEPTDIPVSRFTEPRATRHDRENK